MAGYLFVALTFFGAASERLTTALPHAEIVFVDDDERNVAAANAAGWQALLAAANANWLPGAARLLGLDR